MTQGPPRVLMVGNYPPPFGGVPNHIDLLTRHLADAGWTVEVLSGGRKPTERRGTLTIHKPGYARKALGALRTRSTVLNEWIADGTFPSERPDEWRRFRMLVDVGRDIVRRARIDLISSYNLYGYAPIGAALAAEFGLPHVVSVFGELYKHETFARANASFLKRILQSAAAIASCSRHCARSVHEVLALDLPTHPVNYGVDLAHFKPRPDAAALRARLGLHDGPVVAFVGRLGAEMGLDLFLTAGRDLLTRYPRLQLLAVGQAEELTESARAFEREYAGRAKVWTNCPYAELPDCYAAADVLVVPTRGARTCSSLAAMEAAAVGSAAIVAHDIGGIPEIVMHGQTGLLVQPGDVPALAQAVSGLLEDAALRRQLAAQAHASALEGFSDTRVNHTMQALFEKTLHERATASSHA
jgi:mannosyltransferase